MDFACQCGRAVSVAVQTVPEGALICVDGIADDEHALEHVVDDIAAACGHHRFVVVVNMNCVVDGSVDVDRLVGRLAGAETESARPGGAVVVVAGADAAESEAGPITSPG